MSYTKNQELILKEKNGIIHKVTFVKYGSDHISTGNDEGSTFDTVEEIENKNIAIVLENNSVYEYIARTEDLCIPEEIDEITEE